MSKLGRPTPGRARALTFVALCGLGAVLAGCGSSPAASTSTVATTTTTTTLPLSVEVNGSSPVGPLSSIGPIFRVPVAPISVGQTTPPPMPSGTVGVPGVVKIGYRQLGSGPDLLMIMGEHGTMTWWDPQLLQTLAGSYTVTIFDLPGVGYSQYSSDAQSLDGFADVTAGLIAALGLKQPIVLGWGLGGEVALALAERHPGMASHLVLVDTSPGGSQATSASDAVGAILGSPYVTLSQVSELFYPPSAAADRLAWLGRESQVSPDDIVADAVTEERVIAQSMRADDTVYSLLRRIDVPTLVIYGALDEVFPPADSALLVAHIRHAKQLRLADAGYASIFQDSPQFVERLATFVNS